MDWKNSRIDRMGTSGNVHFKANVYDKEDDDQI